jgi:hypothetical protein
VPLLQRYIDEFRVAQERAKEAQREADQAEERRIAAYNASRSGREQAVAKAKADDDAAKEARYRAIVEEQEAARRLREEEERLRYGIAHCELMASSSLSVCVSRPSPPHLAAVH